MTLSGDGRASYEVAPGFYHKGCHQQPTLSHKNKEIKEYLSSSMRKAKWFRISRSLLCHTGLDPTFSTHSSFIPHKMVGYDPLWTQEAQAGSQATSNLQTSLHEPAPSARVRKHSPGNEEKTLDRHSYNTIRC